MLQKISDFIKSELQSMLKNRQLQSPNLNPNNFLATSRTTFLEPCCMNVSIWSITVLPKDIMMKLLINN